MASAQFGMIPLRWSQTSPEEEVELPSPSSKVGFSQATKYVGN